MATVTATIDTKRAVTSEIITRRAVVGTLDQPYDLHLANLLLLGPVQFLRLRDSGATADDSSINNNDGINQATSLAAMMAQLTGPFGDLAPLFAHSNLTSVDLFSAGLAADIDMSEMSFALAIRAIGAGLWTDATARYPLILRSGTTANQITVQRAIYDGQIFIRRYTGGIIKQTTIVNLSDANWHIISFSVSENDGIQQTYLDGAPYGPAEVPGTWAGGALTLAQVSSPTAGQRWEGGIAEVGLFDRALSDAEQALLAGSYYVPPVPPTDVIDPTDPRYVLFNSYGAALYTRLTEDTGTIAYDWSDNLRAGSYTATSVPAMLSQLDGPYGRRSPLFSVANATELNLFSASLAAAINMAEMSCFIALKVSAVGIWTDATSRNPLLMRSGTTQNQIIIQRTTTNNQLIIRRTAGNVSKTTTLNSFNPTGWFTIGFEVSESGGYQNVYYNGIPEGSAITPDAWAGGALTLAQISPAVGSRWSGGVADFAIFPTAIGAEAQARLAGDFFAGILEADPGDYEHILITGQSLTEGTGSGGALTLTQLYGGNYKMSSRPVSTWLMPLHEVYNTNYPNLESPGSAIGNAIRAASGQQMIITRNGQDGQAYATLKKGTANYADGITQVTNARTRVGSTNYHCAGVSVIHGETDGANGVTAAAYQGYLEEWQSDYQTDINAITGEVGVLPMLLCQMSAQAGTVTNVLKQVSLGQVAACKDNPTLLFMACPKYMFTYADTVHLTAASYRWLGEYHAKAWKSIIAGNGWEPLWPDSVTRDGAVITLTMHVPAGPMVFDTTTVAAVPNYGFEYVDDTSSATISTVAIDGNNIVITLSATPTGANKKIRYAYTNQIGGVGPKGNLRDSDPTASIYGNTLYNWCVHFEEAVT